MEERARALVIAVEPRIVRGRMDPEEGLLWEEPLDKKMEG